MNTKYWQRAIILVDMNAFFASVEQLDYPELRNKPIAVTNGEQGTCIITSSYEARAFGVKTGMRLKEARLLCPDLIQISARSQRYAKISQQIMQALNTITPDMEIFSVDEAFLDVTRCQKLWGDPITIARLVRKKIVEMFHLPCSIGLSGDKSTAKYAAEVQKPNGFIVIPPWEAKIYLQDVPVTELCGIGRKTADFFARYGAVTCGDVAKLPIGVLVKRFGNWGRRMWYMCQGADPMPIQAAITDPKSMGHGKIMPPFTKDKKILIIYLQNMCEKLAFRLRHNHLQAQHFFIGWLSWQDGWLGNKVKLICPSNDGNTIYEAGLKVLSQVWHGEPVNQIQVTALDPQALGQQLDLFADSGTVHNQLNTTLDQINQRYGESTIRRASLLKHNPTNNVIAPSWRPVGPRQSI